MTAVERSFTGIKIQISNFPTNKGKEGSGGGRREERASMLMEE